MVNNSIKVMPIIGVRPQIIKAAPVLGLLSRDNEIELQMINSGQHYDFEMSKIFFNELALPDPSYNLNVGSGSHATQTAKLMTGVEKVINKLNPDVVVVFGDANTTLGGALAAVKMHVPVCHIEAGLRSYDMRMPEEVNRVLTDHCSQMLCAPTILGVNNLKSEGIEENTILLSGDTMYDALLRHEADIEKSTIVKDIGLSEQIYAVLTVHRAENVDDPGRLTKILSAIKDLSNITIVFPIHPRTENRLGSNVKKDLEKKSHVILTPPLSYFDMLCLMKHSAIVITDSGGMQKEAFLFRVPCVTLRDNTEWMETVDLRANILVGAETEKIVSEVARIMKEEGNNTRMKSLVNPYGDGRASEKIVEDLKNRYFSKKLVIKSPTFLS
jgi:UDP-N-acetylglucosamine 2-epimerase